MSRDRLKALPACSRQKPIKKEIWEIKSTNKQLMPSNTKEWHDRPGIEQKLLRFIPIYKLSYLQTTETGKSKSCLEKISVLQCQGFLSLDVGKIITVYTVPFASGSF